MNARTGAVLWTLALSLGCASNPSPTGRTDAATTRDASVDADAAIDAPVDVEAEADAMEDAPPEMAACAMTLCGVLCVDLQTDPTNCGACGRSCVLPHASAACAAGECAIATCDPGFSDANSDPIDGCELDASACRAGESCTTSCGTNGTTACEPMSCAPPAETCNLRDDDCDGECDQGAGCRVGVHRAYGNGGHFYTLDLAEANSGGYMLEFANFYALYRTEQPGTRPFHRCRKASGLRFYTTSSDCEGAGPLEGVLGYIAAAEVCGSRPLFRLYKNPNHFYTTSPAERDNAVDALGYRYESIAGYVW